MLSACTFVQSTSTKLWSDKYSRPSNRVSIHFCTLAVTVDVRDGFFGSDHQQVECVVKHVKSVATLTSRQSAFNYKRADFQMLRLSLQSLPRNTLDGMHVDAAVDAFYDLLNAAISDCIPVVQIRRHYHP